MRASRKCNWSYGPSCPVDFPLNIFIQLGYNPRTPRAATNGRVGVGMEVDWVGFGARLCLECTGHEDGRYEKAGFSEICKQIKEINRKPLTKNIDGAH